MKKLKKYLVVWGLMIRNVLSANLNKKVGFLIFFIGKMLRFVLAGLFVFYTLQGTKSLAGYDTDQVIFFYLTYMLIDALGQVFFRNVYSFRQIVVTGSFDLILSKPVNTLFRVLLGGMDIIDMGTTIFFLGTVVWWGARLSPNSAGIILYSLLIFNSLIIIAAFHILVVALGIITLEIDHTIMIYRDIESMGRFPIDIYKEPIKSIFTFIIPIGIMLTVPAKALMGLATAQVIVVSFIVSGVLLFLSIKFWGFALKRYTSASS